MTEGYHSMIFVDSIVPGIFTNPNSVSSYRHTWDSWHLVPSSRPAFATPPVKELYQDVPGSNGSLDYTDSLTGYPLYGNREGSQEFWVINNQDMPGINQKEWSVLYSEIMNYLHGRRKIVILEDDLGYYYEGRWKVNEWKSDKERSIITLDYNLYPYKKEVMSSLGDWLWDPFNFETGIIREYDGVDNDGLLIEEDEPYTISFEANMMPTIPIIYVTSASGVTLTVKYRNLTNTQITKTLSPSDRNDTNRAIKEPTMLILSDRKSITFESTGGDSTIKIDFKGGML